MECMYLRREWPEIGYMLLEQGRMGKARVGSVEGRSEEPEVSDAA